MGGKPANQPDQRGAHLGCGTAAGQREQHRVAGGAFGEHPNLGMTACADDEIAFPMARHRAVRGFGGPL